MQKVTEIKRSRPKLYSKKYIKILNSLSDFIHQQSIEERL